MSKAPLLFFLLFTSIARGEEAPAQNTPATDPSAEQSEPKESLSEKIVDSHWGAALGFGWIQDYPGANQGRLRYLVIPTYKGKHFTIDRQEGVKGELLNKQVIKFSVSFSFLFPTDSDKIPVRAGMPDLDWTLQLGPELQIYFYKSYYFTSYLRIPLRFVATTDFRHRFEGRDWNFPPSWRNVFYLGKNKGEITTRFDIEYASKRYNALFHEVAPQFATPSRPTYYAKEGVMDVIFGVNYSYYDMFPWTFFIGANVYLMNNSANHESPLLVKQANHSIIGGIVRYF